MSYRSRVYRNRNPRLNPEAGRENFFVKQGSTSADGTKKPFFQTKLTVNEAGDKYEQQADHIANSVVNQGVQRAMMEPEKKKPEEIQKADVSELEKEKKKAPGIQTKSDDSTSSAKGKYLLDHELTHVIQQGASAPIVSKKDAPKSSAQKNFVCYSGGYNGLISVFKDGKLNYSAAAVSGTPGSKQNQKGAGPTPDGVYTLHPQLVNKPVNKLQDGTCGANPISQGYQELTTSEKSPCEHKSHYCNESCAESPVFGCFTPTGCWGTRRMKIEGNRTVVTDDGKEITRDGFYLHGGNPTDLASSGCIKALDNTVFDKIRELKGAVPIYVGQNCPGDDSSAIYYQFLNIITGNLDSMKDTGKNK